MLLTFVCNVSLPPKLEIHSGNLSKEWKQWQQAWDAYEEVTDLRNRTDTNRLRVATFITCIGREALKVHNGLPFVRSRVMAGNHCVGKTNVTYERGKFNNRSQEQTETIDAYVSALRALAETCDFVAVKD